MCLTAVMGLLFPLPECVWPRGRAVPSVRRAGEADPVRWAVKPLLSEVPAAAVRETRQAEIPGVAPNPRLRSVAWNRDTGLRTGALALSMLAD